MSAIMSLGQQHSERGTFHWDRQLLTYVTILLLFGLVMVYSASISIAERNMGHTSHYVLRYFVHALIGIALMVVVMRSQISFWERSGPYLLLIGIVLLVLVLIPGVGTKINGSYRWLRLGAFINIQPAEFVKLFILVYVAGYLVRNQGALRNFTQGILMVSIVVAVVGVLVLRQPDLGTVVVISATVFTMLFLSGVRFWHFLVMLAAGIGGMVTLTLISPYRAERVTGFLNPWADPFNSGFQLTQALIAFGRGEWTGVGLGASIQKMFYLPAAHTDFILAVVAEELGLIVVLAIIVIFGLIISRAFAIAKNADAAGNFYAARLAQGIGLLIGIQAIINIGVNMGVLPTKGLTLPFISYGGSSLIVSFVAIGLLLMVDRDTGSKAWKRR